MFSHRMPRDLDPNRLTVALRRLRRDGVPIVNLTESNPTKVGLDYPSDLLAALADPRARSYDPEPFGLSQAREAVAADCAQRGRPVAADRLVLTASTSEAYSLLFKLLCDPGDKVLVPRPSYPLFAHLTSLDAVVAEPYDLEYQGRWSIDFDRLGRKVSSKTRAILIVNPNNPTGSFVSAEELAVLGAVCRRHSLALIGDEVFADYPLEAGTGRSSVLDRPDALTFCLGGLSKSAGLPQLKLAWTTVAGPDDLVRTALGRLEVIADAYLSVSTPVQLAASRLLDRGAAIRRQITERTAGNLRSLREIAAHFLSCRILPVEGGWSAVVQVPAKDSEEEIVLRLLERDHVLVHPGYFFDFPKEAFLVLSLLPPPETFAPAVGRLLARVAAESR